MHHGLSKRLFLLLLIGHCILMSIFVFHRRARQQHESLLSVMRNYGFWGSNEAFSCFPFAYDKAGRPNGLGVRIRPGAVGTLRTTYYQFATDKAAINEITVNADPKFEFYLSIIQRNCSTLQPGSPLATLRGPRCAGPDSILEYPGWFASSTWSASYNVTSKSNETVFAGESMRYPFFFIAPKNRLESPRSLVAALFLVPPGQVFKTKYFGGVLDIKNFCKSESVDVIAIEYLADSGT